MNRMITYYRHAHQVLERIRIADAESESDGRLDFYIVRYFMPAQKSGL